MHITENAIYDYVDGLLDDEKAQEHISSCPTCFEKIEKIRALECSVSSFHLDEDFISEKMENIYNDIKPSASQTGVRKFFSRKVSLWVAGASAFSFAMVIVGAVRVFSPRSQNIQNIIPAANPNLDRSNIYRISEGEGMSLDEHLRAIEKLGYQVKEYPEMNTVIITVAK